MVRLRLDIEVADGQVFITLDFVHLILVVPSEDELLLVVVASCPEHLKLAVEVADLRVASHQELLEVSGAEHVRALVSREDHAHLILSLPLPAVVFNALEALDGEVIVLKLHEDESLRLQDGVES